MMDSFERSTSSPSDSKTVYSVSVEYDQNMAKVTSAVEVPCLVRTPHDGTLVNVRVSGMA